MRDLSPAAWAADRERRLTQLGQALDHAAREELRFLALETYDDWVDGVLTR